MAATTERNTAFFTQDSPRISKRKADESEDEIVVQQEWVTLTQDVDEEAQRRNELRRIAHIKSYTMKTPPPRVAQLFPNVSVLRSDKDVSPSRPRPRKKPKIDQIPVVKDEVGSGTICGHEVQPGILPLYSKQHQACPPCQLSNAMKHLTSTQQWILDNGGIGGFQGGKKKRGRSVILDDNANDISYRHAKKRWLDLAIELEYISRYEQAWEAEQIAAGAGPDSVSSWQYSATNALKCYEEEVAKGTFNEVERTDAIRMRKRGREWEVSTDPEYPESDEDDKTARHLWPNKVQRQFIEASSIPGVDLTSTIEDNPPKRKRRRIDAKVRINPVCYVRSEADVDELRHAASSFSVAFLEGTTGAPLCTKLYDGPLRSKRQWSRSNRYIYEVGDWTTPDDSENVDTSGDTFKTWNEGWTKYIDNLQQKADDMDAAALARNLEEARAIEEQSLNERPEWFSWDVESEHGDAQTSPPPSSQASVETLSADVDTEQDWEDPPHSIPDIQEAFGGAIVGAESTSTQRSLRTVQSGSGNTALNAFHTGVFAAVLTFLKAFHRI
ncbi:hypothetical protein EK21DRAFT_109210 [Setomelanomma holmii]|uniref:Uncharacterized protein n=1 Tax=Setomelanomma holmii TaxID=210430 RepID=A0A9P4LQB8_9PLEO|nr:hypothetical protein EK21DRAFT_109210 [Setomelanomma holmii]